MVELAELLSELQLIAAFDGEKYWYESGMVGFPTLSPDDAQAIQQLLVDMHEAHTKTETS